MYVYNVTYNIYYNIFYCSYQQNVPKNRVQVDVTRLLLGLGDG